MVKVLSYILKLFPKTKVTSLIKEANQLKKHDSKIYDKYFKTSYDKKIFEHVHQVNYFKRDEYTFLNEKLNYKYSIQQLSWYNDVLEIDLSNNRLKINYSFNKKLEIAFNTLLAFSSIGTFITCLFTKQNIFFTGLSTLTTISMFALIVIEFKVYKIKREFDNIVSSAIPV